MLRNLKEMQAFSEVNGQTIDREVEICQIGLQCLGKCRMKRSLTGGSSSVCQSKEIEIIEFIWETVSLFADMAGIKVASKRVIGK